MSFTSGRAGKGEIMRGLIGVVILGVILLVVGCAGGKAVKPPTPGLGAPTFAVQGMIPGDRPGGP